MECVKAVDELLEHELLDVSLVSVEYLVPDEEETRAVELDGLGVADMGEFLDDTTDGADLPALMEALGLQEKDLEEDEENVVEVLLHGFAQLLLEAGLDADEALVEDEVELAVVVVEEELEFGGVGCCVDEGLEVAEAVLEVLFGVEDFGCGLFAELVGLVACAGSGPACEHVHLWLGGEEFWRRRVTWAFFVGRVVLFQILCSGRFYFNIFTSR